MNKTKIEWTDYTWNPVTGCWGPGGTAEKPKRCSYCYAERVAQRFNNDRMNPRGPRKEPFPPEFHFYRLDQPHKVKKPAKIFVCSMADLFGDWVPDRWIRDIINVVLNCPHHTFQFLTKNPKRLKDFNSWPSNCWIGITVTNQADADGRLPWLLQADAPVKFVSHEPLLSGLDRESLGAYRGQIDWAIIGAMTGPGAVKPQPEWVQGLIDQYRAAGVPVFLKDNLNWFKKIQEWPGD